MKSSPHIVVVGSANVDLTTFTNRFPGAGETIFADRFQFGFGGKGANQAVAARQCGAQVSMVGRVGDDFFGSATLQNFAAHGVDTSHVLVTPGVSSGVAPIFVDSLGQNRILVVKGANDLLTTTDIEAASRLLRGADVIILQLEIPVETVYFTLRFAYERSIPTILNPAPAQLLLDTQAALASYVIPNETEAAVLSGMPVASLDQAKACAHALVRSGMQRVILTLGANGALFATPDDLRQVAAFPVRAIDTSGAGDAFIGSFAFFLASGCEELEAIRRANLYAALSTLESGTQRSYVTRQRFDEEWNRHEASNQRPRPPQST